MSDDQKQNPVQISGITVRTGRLVCDVVIPDERYRYTTPRLAAYVTSYYPDLPHHACVNDQGKTFGDVMEHTSTAHLLEHLTISLQTRENAEKAESSAPSATADKPFTGTTEWVDEEAGTARVEVSFRDDLKGLRAFNKATDFLNVAMLTCLA